MYVVLGANGFLGSYIVKTILDKTQERILAVCRQTGNVFLQHERLQWMAGDIENSVDVDRITKWMHDVPESCKVAYLAACHHPDVVARQLRSAWHTNITCLSAFLEKTDNVECLFYPSTDTVYGEGGEDTFFAEDAIPAPVNAYGVQKATAEAVVRGFGYNVVRYPFLIAPSLLQHKKHFYDVIVETLWAGKPIEMFNDSMRSSLDFSTAASLLVRLMEQYTPDLPKTLNLSGDDNLSKYDIGLMIAKKHGLDTSLVVPISVDQAAGIFEARRAKSTLMDNRKIKQILRLKEIHINF